MNLFDKIFRKKGNNVDISEKEKLIVTKKFVSKDGKERITIFKQYGGYQYLHEKYYDYDDEERKIHNKEGAWNIVDDSFGSYYGDEEQILNDLKDVLKEYTEEKLES